MALEISTADVYEQASLIGQDIERIIDRYGHEAVLDLMPKVVRVLEELEILVSEREKEKLELAELKMENERLYLEIKKEASHRRRLDEELYNIQFDGEANNLKTMVAKLQEENMRLRMEYEVSVNEKLVTTFVSAPGDAEVMRKMKETIDSQRDAIRGRNVEIESQRGDINAMEEQIDRVTNINQQLRRNLSIQQARVNALAKEKAELQAEFKTFKLELSKQENFLMAEGETSEEEVEELEEDEDHNELLDHDTTQMSKSGEKESETAVEEGRNGIEKNDTTNGRHNGTDDMERKEVDGWELIGNGKPKESGEKSEVQRAPEKQVMDPNRPRYTKAELQEILFERNKLKEEVFFLKEELVYYKPKDAYENEEKAGTPVKSPRFGRKTTKREESGISKIFRVFTHRKVDS